MNRRFFLGMLGGMVAVPQFGRWHRQGSGLLVPTSPTMVVVTGAVRVGPHGAWVHREARIPLEQVLPPEGSLTASERHQAHVVSLFAVADVLAPERHQVVGEVALDDIAVFLPVAPTIPQFTIEPFAIHRMLPIDHHDQPAWSV